MTDTDSSAMDTDSSTLLTDDREKVINDRETADTLSRACSPHPAFPALAGRTDAMTLAQRSGLERLFEAGPIRGTGFSYAAIRRLKPLILQLAKFRGKYGSRATRVVARTAAKFRIDQLGGLCPTATGVGFGTFDSIAAVQEKAFRYQFIKNYALSWEEAILAEDFLEAVVTQTPGRFGWADLPQPPRWRLWEQRTQEAALLDAKGDWADEQDPDERDRAMTAFFRDLPPLPPEDPDSQIAAFLKECCDVKMCGGDARPKTETDFAALHSALENWSIQHGDREGEQSVAADILSAADDILSAAADGVQIPGADQLVKVDSRYWYGKWGSVQA